MLSLYVLIFSFADIDGLWYECAGPNIFMKVTENAKPQ